MERECELCGTIFEGDVNATKCPDCIQCEAILTDAVSTPLPTPKPFYPVRTLTPEDIGYKAPTWREEFARIIKLKNLRSVSCLAEFSTLMQGLVDEKRGVSGWHALIIMMKVLKRNPEITRGQYRPLKYLLHCHVGVQRIMKDKDPNVILCKALNAP